MAELGQPETYQGAAPTLEIVSVTRVVRSLSAGSDFEFYDTVGNGLWRIRSVSIQGNVGGSVGTFSLSLQALVSGLKGLPWANTGPLVAACPRAFGPSETLSIIWSTETADNYVGFNNNFGTSVVLGLPLLFLPDLTTISIGSTRTGGSDTSFTLEGGVMQLEHFLPDNVVGANTDLMNVYLLPVNQ